MVSLSERFRKSLATLYNACYIFFASTLLLVQLQTDGKGRQIYVDSGRPALSRNCICRGFIFSTAAGEREREGKEGNNRRGGEILLWRREGRKVPHCWQCGQGQKGKEKREWRELFRSNERHNWQLGLEPDKLYSSILPMQRKKYRHVVLVLAFTLSLPLATVGKRSKVAAGRGRRRHRRFEIEDAL